MKKLSAWQIVLLVIFYPVGICVWIYRVWKKKELQKESRARIDAIARARAEAQEQKEREEAERQAAYEAEKALQYEHEYKVVGVTFKNPDGKSRQAILQKMYFEKPPFNKVGGYEITIEEREYEGEPAYCVFAEEMQIGNISRDDIPYFREHYLEFVRVVGASLHGGGTDADGRVINYGIVIRCLYRKRN